MPKLFQRFLRSCLICAITWNYHTHTGHNCTPKCTYDYTMSQAKLRSTHTEDQGSIMKSAWLMSIHIAECSCKHNYLLLDEMESYMLRMVWETYQCGYGYFLRLYMVSELFNQLWLLIWLDSIIGSSTDTVQDCGAVIADRAAARKWEYNHLTTTSSG